MYRVEEVRLSSTAINSKVMLHETVDENINKNQRDKPVSLPHLVFRTE